MSDSSNSILWTASDVPIPEEIWKRLEDRGVKLLISDKGLNINEKIDAVLPRVWVGQINGDSESVLSQLKEVRGRMPRLPVILIALNSNVDDAVNAIKLGAFDYLNNKFSPDRLWAILEAALYYSFIPAAQQSFRAKQEYKKKRFIACHSSMERLLQVAKKIAPSRSTVLIRGETGVGKEVLARYIHENSNRSDGPFIAVNCAALPENLLESELFGHEKGAFTGAVNRKKGKFELASGGSLLLDEISETAVSIQAKLLRVLQEKEIDRVGGQCTIPVDTRVIATTNRELDEEVREGRFRSDLFYRLNVVPLVLPPLRERKDDIQPLAEFFLEKHCQLNNIPKKSLSSDALTCLKTREWPGNVREFENLIERCTLLIDSEKITASDLEMLFCPVQGPAADASLEHSVLSLKEMEKKMIIRALDDHKGNRTHAAKMLGISVRTLRNKLHEYEANYP
ncbi:MAG: sigma-54-dependent Fis family transcriptional regulator, partial [Deltaproteobacteria bacterium]|nr:sigma-54-dependent Fis family transcriptional regulator [Deltaproteobacteria bacterium]